MRGDRLWLGMGVGFAAGLVAAAGATWALPALLEEPVPVDVRRAILVLHHEWAEGAAHATSLGRTCPDGSGLLQSELDAVRRVVERAGYVFEVVRDDTTPDALEGVDLLLHHNGGWGSSLTRAESALLLKAHYAKIPVVLLGDDAAAMLASDLGFRDIAAAFVVDNGMYPTTVHVGGRARVYAKEPDVVRRSPKMEVLAEADGTPAVWIARNRPHAPVAVFGLGLRASDVCPLWGPGDEQAAADLLLQTIEAVSP